MSPTGAGDQAHARRAGEKKGREREEKEDDAWGLFVRIVNPHQFIFKQNRHEMA
jgi:hypothetical protein